MVEATLGIRWKNGMLTQLSIIPLSQKASCAWRIEGTVGSMEIHDLSSSRIAHISEEKKAQQTLVSAKFSMISNHDLCVR